MVSYKTGNHCKASHFIASSLYFSILVVGLVALMVTEYTFINPPFWISLVKAPDALSKAKLTRKGLVQD
jgi:hypothetical protein